jgi:murein DD-endopeptidase MepM/ murein hydrolase activator NlpD
MQQVGESTGIPWQILAAIARVESSFGSNMETSSAGAIGYGQFLPEMWDVYGNGGDPYDFHDALPAMGRYLLGAGAPDDMEGAIFSYNHSVEYVAGVLSIAAAYGYQGSETGVPLISSDGLIWPVIGLISSYFTPDHQAIDIDQTDVPGAPVRAAHSGVVLFAGGDPCCSYGLYVLVVGPSSITTLYAHMDMLAVTPGQTVLQGQSLGAVGCTGNCTGPHLHFEILEGGVRRNPLDYLP